MLNRADPFFALIPREGGVVFLPKAGVSVVACPEPSPWIDPDRVTAAKQLELAVELPNGQEYRGHAAGRAAPFAFPGARLRKRHGPLLRPVG